MILPLQGQQELCPLRVLDLGRKPSKRPDKDICLGVLSRHSVHVVLRVFFSFRVRQLSVTNIEVPHSLPTRNSEVTGEIDTEKGT